METNNSWEENAARQCPIARSLDVLGEKWTLLILRDIARGLTQFNEIETSLGCSRALLTQRLKKLVNNGIIEKVTYQEAGQRTRHRYQLARAGIDFLPVLGAMQEWGMAHFPQEVIPIGIPVHRDCAQPVRMALTCAHGHDVHPDSIDIVMRVDEVR